MSKELENEVASKLCNPHSQEAHTEVVKPYLQSPHNVTTSFKLVEVVNLVKLEGATPKCEICLLENVALLRIEVSAIILYLIFFHFILISRL
jgi:hypothetical protein